MLRTNEIYIKQEEVYVLDENSAVRAYKRVLAAPPGSLTHETEFVNTDQLYEGPSRVLDPIQMAQKLNQNALQDLILQLHCSKCNLVYPKPSIQEISTCVCTTCNKATTVLYQCRNCNKRYKICSSALLHVRNGCDTAVNGEKLKCQLCLYETRRKSSMNRHWRHAHLSGAETDTAIKCDKCGRRYNTKYSLQNHQKIECGQEPKWHCKSCPYKCYYEKSLSIHTKNKHETKDESNNYPCNKCGKSYKKLDYLKIHLKRVCGVIPKFNCDLCSYKATRKYPNLASHLQRKHSKLFPKNAFKCTVCRKKFKCQYDFNHHVRVCNKK